jgi:transcriptional regulator with XRE-family HTH domain
MTAIVELLPVAECFRHDGRVTDWQRVGKYVVDRRVELGFKTRSDLASAVQVTARTLGDIENGRRGNFDAVTIASLERVLGWETGSLKRIADGGEPQLRGIGPERARGQMGMTANALNVTATITAGGAQPGDLDEIDMIVESTLSPERKLRAIRQVLLLRAQAQAEQAEARAQHEAPAPDAEASVEQS